MGDLNDWDPMAHDYYNAENAYDTGPGRHMPDDLQPGNYRNNSDKLFKLYISGLKANITESSIRNLFSKFGKIYKISMDKENHYWAILSYYTQQAANNAIAQMNNHPEYGFRVSYKIEKVATDASVGCQFSYNNLNQDILPLRTQRDCSQVFSSSSSIPVDYNRISTGQPKKMLPPFKLSANVFRNKTSVVDNDSQGSRDSAYSNMDLPPDNILFCIVCNSKTMGFCTGCDLSFCNQQCMLTGIDRHKNCVKLPTHDLRCLRPDSENNISIPIYAHDATSLRRVDDVRSFSEDIREYTINSSRDHKPTTRISNEYYNANEVENDGIVFPISNSNRLAINPSCHRNQNGVAWNHKVDNRSKMNDTRQKCGPNDLSLDYIRRNENDVRKNDRNIDKNANTNNDGNGNMSVYIENRVTFELNAVFKIRACHLVKTEPFIIAARFVDEERLYESFKDELNREMNLKPASRIGVNDKVIVCRGKEKFRAVIVRDSSRGLSVVLEDEGLNSMPHKEQLKAPLSKYIRAPIFSTKMEFMNYEERELVQEYIKTRQPFKIKAKSKEKHLWRVEIVTDGEKELVDNQVKNQNNRKFRSEHNMSWWNGDVNMLQESTRSRPRSINRQSDGKLIYRGNNDYKPVSKRTIGNKAEIPQSVIEESTVAEYVSQMVKNNESCSSKSVVRRSIESTDAQDKVPHVSKDSENRNPKSVDRRSIKSIDAKDEVSQMSKNNKSRSLKSVDQRSAEPIDAEDEVYQVSKDNEHLNLKSVDQRSVSSEVGKPNDKPNSPYGFTLIEGQWAKVVRTQVEESDGSFYVCDHNEMLQMATEITKLDVENLSTVEEVHVGLVCFAKYVDSWYRAIVTNTDPLEVLFLDFGNYEKIEGNLKKISQDLASINALAIKVKLISEDGTSADVIFGDDPNIAIFAVEKGTSVTPWIVSTREFYEVVPVWPIDNRNLFVVRSNDFHKLHNIANIPKPKIPLQCDVEPGLMCLCFFDGDGGRARVKKTEPLTVNYIDYGNDEEVSYDKLFELPEKWRNIPGMAFRIKLEDSVAKTLLDGQAITIWRKSCHEAFKMSIPMKANSSPVEIVNNGVKELNSSMESAERNSYNTVEMLKNQLNYEAIDTVLEGKSCYDDEGILSPFVKKLTEFQKNSGRLQFRHIIDEIDNNSDAEFIEGDRLSENIVSGMLVTEKWKKAMISMNKAIKQLKDTSYKPKKGEMVACTIGIRGIVLHEPTITPFYKLLSIDLGVIHESNELSRLPEYYKNIPVASSLATIKQLHSNSLLQKYHCEIRSSNSKTGHCEGMCTMKVKKEKIGSPFPVKFTKYELKEDLFGLEPLPLKIGDYVKLVSFKMAKDCFIIPADEDAEQNFIDLMDAVNYYAEKCPPLKKVPLVGEVVLVSIDDTNCRGSILEKENDCFRVELVDKGCEKLVLLNQMKELPDFLKLPPRFTIHVELSNVRIAETNNKVQNFLNKNLVFELLEVESKPTELPKVTLKFVKGTTDWEQRSFNTVNDFLNELLTPEWLLTFLRDGSYQPEPQKFDNLNMEEQWVDGSVMSLIVTDYLPDTANISVCDPDGRSRKEFLRMNVEKRIEEYCNKIHNPCVLRPNELCLAKLRNGTWGRAVVYEGTPGERFLLHFLDNGRYEKVWHTEMRRIPEEFLIYTFISKSVTVLNYSEGLNLNKLIYKTVRCKIVTDKDTNFQDVEIEDLEKLCA